MHPKYSVQYAASIVVTVIAAMLGAVLVGADALELSRRQLALLGIGMAGLTMLAGFLPKVTKYPAYDRIGMD